MYLVSQLGLAVSSLIRKLNLFHLAPCLLIFEKKTSVLLKLIPCLWGTFYSIFVHFFFFFINTCLRVSLHSPIYAVPFFFFNMLFNV